MERVDILAPARAPPRSPESLSHCRAVRQISSPPPSWITGSESPEERQHEMPDGQAAQPDEQIVGDDPPDDRLAVFIVQPRQKPVDQEARTHGVRHRKQRHEGGYEREKKSFL